MKWDTEAEESRLIAAALRRTGAANLLELLSDPKHEKAADELAEALTAVRLKHWQPAGRGC